MLVPSKFTRLEESTLFKMKSILDSETEEESVQDIYRRTRDVFWDASEFLHALDALFVLALLEIDADSGLIQYA